MSTPKFRVGQRCIALSNIVKRDKRVCTVVGIAGHDDISWVYWIDVPEFPPPPRWYIAERYLRPLYDGDQPVSWADCAWKPKEKQLETT